MFYNKFSCHLRGVNPISLPAIIITPEAYSNRHAPPNEVPFSYSASSLSFL